MNMGRLFLMVVAGAAVWLGAHWLRDPHRTALPFGTTDLSSVQVQLARLPAEERKLVEDYVKRSNGDVLTPAFADPDEPLTARNFADAIELQRRWLAKRVVQDAHAAELKAGREARRAPLRELVDASVVRAEILARNDFQALQDPAFYQRPHEVDKSPVFVLKVRVENLGNDRILAMRGGLQAHDRDAYLPLDLCWIDLREQLAPHDSVEFYCGHDFRQAGQQQKDFVADPPGRFEVEWQPQYVKLEDGRELDSGR